MSLDEQSQSFMGTWRVLQPATKSLCRAIHALPVLNQSWPSISPWRKAGPT